MSQKSDGVSFIICSESQSFDAENPNESPEELLSKVLQLHDKIAKKEIEIQSLKQGEKNLFDILLSLLKKVCYGSLFQRNSP